MSVWKFKIGQMVDVIQNFSFFSRWRLFAILDLEDIFWNAS